MESKIIKQEKNPFLQREELIVEIKADSAPSMEEVVKGLGKDEALTVVKKINTNFGRQTFLTELVVYDNIEARESIETIPQKVRKKMEAEKKVAAENAKKEAEAAKKAEEEAKAASEASVEEEKTEEVKSEEKSE